MRRRRSRKRKGQDTVMRRKSRKQGGEGKAGNSDKKEQETGRRGRARKQ